MTIETDVLICGAGASGLAMAIELARRGVAFRLIDKRDEPFAGSRGKGVQPRTQEIFEDMGVVDRVAAAGGFYPPQRVHRDDGSFVDSSFEEDHAPTPAEPYGRILMIPQFRTEAILRERLKELGAAPQFGAGLTRFAQDGEGVFAELEGGESVRAKYLVGADGGRSFVRHALDIGFPGKTLGVRAMVADVAMTGLSRDAWHRFHEGDMSRRISFCPLAGTDLFQIQAPIPPEGEFDLSAAALNVMAAERTGRDDLAIQSVSWASAYAMNARLADRYRIGRVFLIGDAAHIHPPTGGQGLNTSVQDAYNLGWKLAATLQGAPNALLDSYEEERRPVAAAMLGLATKLLEAAGRGDMRRGRETRQLDIGYPGSSLALDAPDRGVRGGDRAPDAPIVGAAGQTRRLFDLFQGTHWTALCIGAPPAWFARRNLRIHRIGAGGEIQDNDILRDVYGLRPGDIALVRPDGYVGAIVPKDGADALRDYLAKVGLSA